MSRRLINSTTTLVAVVVLVAIGFSRARAIEDWWKLRNYTAPANVAGLAREDTMTAAARHIFYVNHPALVASASTFRQDCPES